MSLRITPSHGGTIKRFRCQICKEMINSHIERCPFRSSPINPAWANIRAAIEDGVVLEIRSKYTQKDLIKAQIKDAHTSRERSNYSDNQQLSASQYEERMSLFYSYCREMLIPEWIKTASHGIPFGALENVERSEELYLEAMREYAKEDWIRRGFDIRTFDTKLRRSTAKKHRNQMLRGAIVAIIGTALTAIGLSVALLSASVWGWVVYFIWYGAIVYGTMDFFRGIYG